MNLIKSFPKRTLFLFLASLVLITALPFSAQARYDPSYQWYTVRNDHFILYYPKGHELAAQRILNLSKKVYKEVTAYLEVKPPLCPIVLDPGTDLFNGYMTLFPSRISLYETPRHSLTGFGPASDLMELVFIHEYTHFVHITTRLGWYGVLSRFLGEGLAVSNILSPGWFIEGITTNTETLLTDGGRGRSPFFLGEMRSFTEDPGLWDLNAAAVASPYAPPRGRIYLAGYQMVEYLTRTYGPDALARMSRYQAEQPLFGTTGALKKMTGKSPREFYQDFLQDYLARSASLKTESLATGLPPGRVVAADEKYLNSFESHFWTKQGTLLAFRQGYDQKNVLVEIDPHTGKILKEINTGRLYPLSARRLPDGRFLLAEVFYHPLGEATIDSADLVIIDPRTMARRRLTRNQHIYSADLSPDGRTIAAVRRLGLWTEVVLLDADGTNLRPLISKPGLYFDAPRWSPDGSRIVTVIKNGRNTDLVLIDPRSRTMNLLFKSDLAEDYEPEFSRDGEWLVFSSDRSGIPNIYAWNFKNKALMQMTSVPFRAGNPQLSPDGKMLSFSNLVRGVKEIRLLPFDPDPHARKIVRVAAPSEVEEPDLKRLQPEVSFTGQKGIPLKAYKPFLHMPYYLSDEKGERAGVYFMGADPVGKNAYSLDLFYGFNAQQPGFDFNLTNKAFWPALGFRVYDTPLEGNTIASGRDFQYRESGAQGSVALSIIHRAVPDFISSSLQIGSRFRRFQSLDDRIRIREDTDQSFGFFGALKVSRRPDAALRDMVPSWGQDLYLFYEKGISELGGKLPGHNGVISFSQNMPSFFKHQGLILTMAHQSQEGLLSYNKDLCLPRGYKKDDSQGGINKNKNLLFRIEYHFPIRYTDSGWGMYLYHSDLFKGSVFIDHSAGWDKDLTWDYWQKKAVTSLGLTLTNKGVLLAVLPLEIGLQTGYKLREGGGFVNLILKLNL
ncbi:MAG: hypothetical protein AB1585_16035 [Thermodesulfobacteriota bacterium]